MKSFVAYPLELNSTAKNSAGQAGKLIAHYELFKKIVHLNGAVIKCGITAEEGFKRFAQIKELCNFPINHKMIAFEKFQPLVEEVTNLAGEKSLQVNTNTVSLSRLANDLVHIGIKQNIEFIPGRISESIPDYLIKNPELKIAFLNIDLDDYESALTTLEFLYPRIMPGGVLVLDNYDKTINEKKAVHDYFWPNNLSLQHFFIANGPHYVVKP